MNALQSVLPLKKQHEVSIAILEKRLASVLPQAMREAGIDMWLILCQEDDYDPVFKTLVPLRTWAPILQMLVFFDRGEEQGIERINLSMTDLGQLYERPWKGRHYAEQWEYLARLVAERDPQKIGINTGSIQWAAGGLTHNLYRQLCTILPEKYVPRLVSAEAASTRWLETLTGEELQYYPHLVRMTRQIIRQCFSAATITPGVTTTDDLEWAFWEISQKAGLELSFIPFFNLVRSNHMKLQFPVEDKIIRPGDLIHCDVGNRYLRLCSDLQEWAYVRAGDEQDVPPGFNGLFKEVNRLQKVFMAEFATGLSGDELLGNILARAHSEGISEPRIYSHSLGYYLHEPGPLVGLPWEQVSNPGRGDVRLVPHSTFTMELSIDGAVPEWDGQVVRFSCEQDVCFDGSRCYAMAGVQTSYHLI